LYDVKNWKGWKIGSTNCLSIVKMFCSSRSLILNPLVFTSRMYFLGT
jgi:hypothetical protein